MFILLPFAVNPNFFVASPHRFQLRRALESGATLLSTKDTAATAGELNLIEMWTGPNVRSCNA